MRKILSFIGVIIIFLLIVTICFANTNGAIMYCVNTLEEAPCNDEEVIDIYLNEISSEKKKTITDNEEYLLREKGILVVDEEKGQCRIKRIQDNEEINIYYPVLFKKGTLSFELYYLTDEGILIRHSDKKNFGKIV